MIREITLKNFQGFKGEQTVRLAPITLIYGPNASGKSSISRALRLIAQSSQSGADEPDYNGDLVTLQSARNVVFGQGKVETCRFGIKLVIDSDNPLSDELPFSSHGFEVEILTPESLALLNEKTAGPHAATMSLQSFEHSLGFLRPAPGTTNKRVTDFELEVQANVVEPNLRWRNDGPIDLGSPLWVAIQRELAESWRVTLDLDEPEQLLEELAELVYYGAAFRLRQGFRLSGIKTDHLGESLGSDEQKLMSGETPFTIALGEYIGLESDNFSALMGRLNHVGPVRQPRPRVEEISGRERRQDSAIVNRWLANLTNGRYQIKSDYPVVSDSNAAMVIRTNLIHDTFSGAYVGYSDVGSGLTQVLPILMELDFALALDEPYTLLIEQPELHLHPYMQAALADVFLEAVEASNGMLQLIVETHSEAILLRLGKRIRQTYTLDNDPERPDLHTNDATVIFTEPALVAEDAPDAIRGNVMYNIEFQEDGELTSPMPLTFAGLRLEDLVD